MAVFAEFTVPGEALLLGGLFEEDSGVSIELDRSVPTQDTFVPYVWLRNCDGAEIREVLGNQRALETVEVIDEVDDVVLARIDWNRTVQGFFGCIGETDVSLLRGRGTNGEWDLEIRSSNREHLSAFQQCCTDRGIPTELNRIHTLAEMNTGYQYDLTPEQREALVLAFREGYYADPSETSLEALAAQLDISRPSMSARLKRGYRNLVGSTLATHEPASDW